MKKTVLYALLALGIISFAGVGIASADTEAGRMNGPGIMHGSIIGRLGIAPGEMRSEFKPSLKRRADMTDEERAAFKERAQEAREERRAEMEEFMGLPMSDVMEARKNGQSMGDILKAQGKTQEDATNFLTERANERVTMIVERHDLDSTQEQRLRDRLAQFVQNIVDRWFATD